MGVVEGVIYWVEDVAVPIGIGVGIALLTAVLLLLARTAVKLGVHVIPHFEGEKSLPKQVEAFDVRLTEHLRVEEAEGIRTREALEALDARLDDAFRAIGAGNPEYRPPSGRDGSAIS